jgi:thioredoxin reductase
MSEFYRIKLYANRLESKFLNSSLRLINIDPGYIDKAKLVLASTKDYAHRIYLQKGIFAEVTLTYRGNSFSPNDWSYPDYRSKEYIDIFNQIRALYTP